MFLTIYHAKICFPSHKGINIFHLLHLIHFALIKIQYFNIFYVFFRHFFFLLREYVNEEEREEDESEEQDSTLASKATVDFQALRKINLDIIAWIRIPDTKIDYPIVQGKNNAYYLKHMFQKTEHAAGSIFLDVDNEADFSNRKSILYGHNMKDGSMFQGLHRFQEESYLQEHNQVYLYLPDNRELV